MRTFYVLVIGWIVGAALVFALAGTRKTANVPPPPKRPATTGTVATAMPGPQIDGGQIVIPVSGVERSALRDTFTQARSGGRVHDAIDILAPRGTPVVAAVDGSVRKLFTSGAGGLTIYEFDLASDKIYYYAHLDSYAAGLHEGQPLRAGELVGYVGTTGNAPPNTPHLHFAIERLPPTKEWWRGVAINPYPLLVANGVTVNPMR